MRMPWGTPSSILIPLGIAQVMLILTPIPAGYNGPQSLASLNSLHLVSATGRWIGLQLRGWLEAGVVFTKSGGWTTDNIGQVLDALNRVRSVLGSSAQAALGLVNGQTLVFDKESIQPVQGVLNLEGRTFYTPGQYPTPIKLWIPDFLDSQIHETVVEMVIHELGHVVDWHAGRWWAGKRWSDESADWVVAQTVSEPGVRRIAVTPYAETDPGENFAEQFAWYIEQRYPGSGGLTGNIGRPGLDWRQIYALQVAISLAAR